MEKSFNNNQYRDALAQKIRAERAAGNTEKSQQILDEQKNTQMYTDAKSELRDSIEVKNARLAAIDKLIAQKQQEIEQMKSVSATLSTEKSVDAQSTNNNLDVAKSTEKPDIRPENTNVQPEKIYSVAGYNFNEMNADAKSKFQYMNRLGQDSPDYQEAKKQWEQSVKKVEAFETLFGTDINSTETDNLNQEQSPLEYMIDNLQQNQEEDTKQKSENPDSNTPIKNELVKTDGVTKDIPYNKDRDDRRAKKIKDRINYFEGNDASAAPSEINELEPKYAQLESDNQQKIEGQEIKKPPTEKPNESYLDKMPDMALLNTYRINEAEYDSGRITSATFKKNIDEMKQKLIDRGIMDGDRSEPEIAKVKINNDRETEDTSNPQEFEQKSPDQTDNIDKLINDLKNVDESENLNKEKSSKPSKESLDAIIASADKSLEWMLGKNAAWVTPSMIAREERKKREAQLLQKNGSKEKHKEKKTFGAGLVSIAERNKKLSEKSPKRAGWFNRMWKKHRKGYLVAAALTTLLFTVHTCESGFGNDNNDDKEKTPIETITEKQSICEYIEANDGYSQVLQKALRNNPDIAQNNNIDPENPTQLKQLMENMKVIDIETGREIRFTDAAIGTEVEFIFDADGNISALVHMDQSPNAEPERYITDSFGKTTTIDNTVATPFN